MTGKYKTVSTLSVWLVVSFGPGLPFPGQKPGAPTVSSSEAEESFLEGEEGATERQGEEQSRKVPGSRASGQGVTHIRGLLNAVERMSKWRGGWTDGESPENGGRIETEMEGDFEID